MTTRFTTIVAAAMVWLGGTVFVAQENRLQRTASPTWESCDEMHDYYVRRFEGTPGFGSSRMLQPRMLDRSGTLDTHHVSSRDERRVRGG